MTDTFQPRRVDVPGLLTDDAFQERLKQFSAGQQSTPLTNSAVEFTDKIIADGALGAPKMMHSPRGAGGRIAAPKSATRVKQDTAIDVRSDILSESTILKSLFAPAIMFGEGGIAERYMGGLLSPEESQQAAQEQLDQAKKDQAAIQAGNEARMRTAGLIDNDSAGGMRSVLMGTDTDPATIETAAQVLQSTTAAQAEVAAKEKAVTDTEAQPKQSVWLNAIRAGYKGAVSTGLDVPRAGAALWEMTAGFIANGAELERSDARAWIDTVDATLEKMMPGDKARSTEFVTQLAQGGGSMAAFMMGGFVAKSIGMPANAATAMMGAAAGGITGLEDAERFDGTAFQKYVSFLVNAGIGVSEAAPIDRMFLNAEHATGGLVSRMLRTTTAASLEEFIQEFGQSVGADVVAQWTYDTARQLNFTEYAKQGLIGAITGGIAGASVQTLNDLGVGSGVPAADPQAQDAQREAIALQVIDDLQSEFDVGQQAMLASPPDGGVPRNAEQVRSMVDAIIANPELRPVTTRESEFVDALQRPTVLRSTEGEAQYRGGTMPPVNENGKIELTHWASEERDVLDPAQQGSGPLRGPERGRLGPQDAQRTYYGVNARGPGLTPRSYAFEPREFVRLSPDERQELNRLRAKQKDINPRRIEAELERRFQQTMQTVGYANEGLGSIRHTVEVDPNDLYNVSEDPAGLKQRIDPAIPVSEQGTQLENLIKAEGFKGAYYDQSKVGQTAILFDKAKPKSAIDERYGIPAKEVAKPEDFIEPTAKTFSDRGGWAILTATQEAQGDATSEANVEANRKLEKELKARGIKFDKISGAYQGVDQGPSYLIYAPEETALRIGKKYKQESILTRRGLEYGDGRLVPAVPKDTVVGEQAEKKDFFSKLPSGVAFSMGLDFDGMVDPNADTDIFAKVTEPARVEKLTKQIPGLKGVKRYLQPDEAAKLTKRSAEKIVDLFGQLPDPKEMAAVAHSGRAKRGWYMRSANALVDIFGLEDAPRFTALLAAMSPQTSVESNAVNALTMWANWIEAGRPTDAGVITNLMGKSVQGAGTESSVLPAWINNTVTALTDKDPTKTVISGPKVNSFMLNLQGVTNEVTNDAWMANFANIDQTLFKKAGQSPGKGPGYVAMSAVTRAAAEAATKLSGETWTAAEIQETVWSWAKTLYEKAGAKGETRTAEQIVKAGGLTADEIGATPDFAMLFVGGAYRNILEKAGYDLDSVAAGSGATDAGGGGRGLDPHVAEGSGLAQRTYERHLQRAAQRLDALRARRKAEEAGPAGEAGVSFEETFFPDADDKPQSQGYLTADDYDALDEGVFATVALDTDAFKKWFGDSKVVDESGAPLVVYHGTFNAEGFEEAKGFSSDFKGDNDFGSDADIGFFFSRSPDVASNFAGEDEGSGVLPVFVSLQNPMRVEGAVFKQMIEEWDSKKFSKWRSTLDKNGYDGAIIGALPNAGPGWVQFDAETYIAFRPEQIKSVNNAGEFDPSNPDILASQGGTSAGRGPFKAEPTRPDQGVPSQPGQQATPDIALSKISANFVKALDLTVRQGRLTAKGGSSVMGQYSRRTDVTRLRSQNDLSTLVHEGGHALYFSAGANLQQFVAANDQALRDVGTALYGGDTNLMDKKTHTAEGFAEFFRIYVTNRNYALRKYPQLTQQFEVVLDQDAPQLKRDLEIVRQQFSAWLQLPSAQLVSNMVVSGKQNGALNEALAELREEGFGTWMREIGRNALANGINQFAHFDKTITDLLNLGQKNQGKAIDLKRADDPRVLIRLTQNGGARAQVQLTDGVMGHRSTQPMTRGLREALLRYHGLKEGQNLSAIDPVRQQDFAAYLIALRGIDEYRRLDEGKIERPPLAATLGDLRLAANELQSKYGQDFVDAANIVHEYAMGLWQKSYDAGLIDKDTYTDGLDRQFYAPLQRDMSDKGRTFGDGALTGGKKLVKRFRGSDRDIIDPMDVLMQKTFALEQNINKNEVMKMLAQLSDRAGKAGAFVERIPASTLVGKQFSFKEVARQLTKDDTITAADAVDLMTILEAGIQDDKTLSLFRSEQAAAAGENILFFWENGKLAAIQLVDGEVGADIVNTVNGLGRENMPMFMDLIASTSAVARNAITLWPDFLAVNFIRDQMSAFILTGVGYKPFVSGFKGVYDELRQKQWAKQYNAAMGMMGGMNVSALHKARVDRDIGSLRKKGYIASAFQDGAIRGMGRVTELAETGTRLGIFQNAYKRGIKDGLSDWEASIEASYIATDYMNFGLNGSKMLMWRRTVPFLNAQLQGLYKMMRTLGATEVAQRKGLRFALSAYFKSTKNMDLSRTEKQAIQTGRKAWIKMASLGLISAALHFLFRDDEDYQEAGEYLRTTGWVIPAGEGRIYYIPKPFELAVLANFTERALEFASGDDTAPDRLLRGMAMTMLPPVAPPAIQTAVELMANKDFFSGREIVPDYMGALSPELQFNNYTSELAKQIGETMGWSPMKVDHVMSGFGASAYRDITAMYNSTNPNRPEMDAYDTPIARRFVRDARRGSTSARDFWGMASTVDGTLRRAELTYRRYREAGNDQAANQFLATQDEDHQAYALLMEQKAELKRLNPFYRTRQVNTVVSAMRRELVSDLGLDDTTFKNSGDTFKISKKTKNEVDQLLSEYSRREMRNTLVSMGAPGWAGKARMDTEETLNLLGATAPEVELELRRRMDKAKIYNAATVEEYWPEVKNRLLADRENVFLDDILATAKAGL